MPTIRKKQTRRTLKPKTTTVIVIEKYISPEEISCPEKVAAAKAMLRNVKIEAPGFGPFNIYPD